MRVREVEWIRERLLGYGVEHGSPLLNIGSQTSEYREKSKPHIEERLFGPLRGAGFQIVHSDLQAAAGVDMVGDVTDPDFQAELRRHHFKAVLNNNLLEHIAVPEPVARACEEIVGPGGLIVVTVPYSYPYHPDPIDTLFRPSPAELGKMFAGSDILDSAVVADGNFTSDSLRKGVPGIARLAGKLAYRLARTIVRPMAAKRELHWVLWLVRSYKVSCAVLRVR